MAFRKKIHILRISPILFLLWAGLIYSYAQDIPKTTKVTISTSGPVKYQHYIKEDPPAIVIVFKSKNVFSSWEGMMSVNRGAIKEIRTEYYSTKANEPQALKSLIFMLIKKASYNITQTNNAIVLEIENPPLSEGIDLSLGEVVIPGKFESELEIQRKEVLDKIILEAKERLEEPKKEEPKKKLLIISKGKPSRHALPKTKTSSFFYLLFLPALTLLGGYFLWKKKRRTTKLGPLDKLKPVLAMEDFKALQRELDKIKQEKFQLEVKVVEKENLEKRLMNIELSEAQLQKTKKELEELNVTKQLLEDKIKVLEKQLEEKCQEIESLKMNVEHKETNLEAELKTKDELIKELNEEKESLKIEVVKMRVELKEKMGLCEKLESKLKEKEAIEKVPDKEVLKEESKPQEFLERRENPRIELVPLGNKGMLLKVVPQDKTEPYLIGMVKNISSTGIMTQLDRELLTDSLNMSLFEHNSLNPIEVLGKLIWQKQDEAGKFRVGMSFISISEDNQKRINEYISKIETLSTNNP